MDELKDRNNLSATEANARGHEYTWEQAAVGAGCLVLVVALFWMWARKRR